MCVINHRFPKMHVGCGVQLHLFWTLALNGGEWSALCLGHFIHTSGKEPEVTNG